MKRKSYGNIIKNKFKLQYQNINMFFHIKKTYFYIYWKKKH